MAPRAAALVAAVLAMLAAASPAAAQLRGISVGTFTSDKSCSLYQVQHGREAAVVTARGAAYARSWRTELVRDCVSNFSGLASSIRTALASSGRLAGGPRYVLTGRVFDVGVEENSVEMEDMGRSTQEASVSIELMLRDAAGRPVWGEMLTKRLTVNDSLSTAGLSTQSTVGGSSVYSQLQREIALAVARAVAFRLEPLKVTEVDGRLARVNYGAPFLPLGATVFVEGPGLAAIKCVVGVSNSADSSVIEPDGSGSLAQVRIGSPARFVDADDPAANARRTQRVDLP